MRWASLVLMAMLAAPAAMAEQAEKPPQRGWEQKFAQANTSHDGRLTLEQAKAAHYRAVARHFAEIDLDAKGYVTEADIRAWHKSLQVRPKPAPAGMTGDLRPRLAMHRVVADPALTLQAPGAPVPVVEETLPEPARPAE